MVYRSGSTGVHVSFLARILHQGLEERVLIFGPLEAYPVFFLSSQSTTIHVLEVTTKDSSPNGNSIPFSIGRPRTNCRNSAPLVRVRPLRFQDGTATFARSSIGMVDTKSIGRRLDHHRQGNLCLGISATKWTNMVREEKGWRINTDISTLGLALMPPRSNTGFPSTNEVRGTAFCSRMPPCSTSRIRTTWSIRFGNKLPMSSITWWGRWKKRVKHEDILDVEALYIAVEAKSMCLCIIQYPMLTRDDSSFSTARSCRYCLVTRDIFCNAR